MHLDNFPKTSLGFFPTPICKLDNLSKAIGNTEIYMKRDDQTGLAFGGNKTRKLEYILGDALKKGCNTIISAGASQSNHCRQTAAAAAKLGLECHLVLGGKEPSKAAGNLLLDKLLGSHIHWSGEHRKGEDIPALFTKLKDAGKKPYIVPYGGSNELGAVSFIEATREFVNQCRSQSEINNTNQTTNQTLDKPFTHIVFASSSGGTHAGLMIGKTMFHQSYQLVGINIDKPEEQTVPGDHIIELANQTAPLVDMSYQFNHQDLVLNSNYLGGGYGVVSEVEKEAVSLTAKTEGILLDPVYTGRAMGGLIGMIRTGEISSKDKVLFWHTGGAPALFAYSDSLDL